MDKTLSPTETKINYALRILLSALFIVSALAKLYPSPNFALTTFEIKQLVPMGFSENFAAWFSRTLTASEFALGIALLQPHFFKRLVLPLSFLLLLIFVGHLSYTIATTGDEGNCGCFGELLPMTPKQAIIKNIIAMAIIAWLYRRYRFAGDRLNFFVITTIAFGSIMTLFMIAPHQKSAPAIAIQPIMPIVEPIVNPTPAPLPKELPATAPADAGKTVSEAPEAAKPVAEPKHKQSGYAIHFADIDKGKKILCFFAAGCEHCQATIRELTQLKKSIKDFPEIRICFMDEETELIPAFFEQAGATYPYKILDVASFWKYMGVGKDTPGVIYLWNGNVLKEYNGIADNAFSKSGMKKAVAKEWK